MLFELHSHDLLLNYISVSGSADGTEKGRRRFDSALLMLDCIPNQGAPDDDAFPLAGFKVSERLSMPGYHAAALSVLMTTITNPFFHL
jgi:hypothetical protein